MSKSQVDKVDAWIKEAFPTANISKEEIKGTLLRGPFKDVLLDFLVPRYRSSEAIDVIRSNLYVHGHSDNAPLPAPESDKEKALKEDLEEWNKARRQEFDKLEQNMERLDKENWKGRESPDHEHALCVQRRELKDLEDMIKYTQGVAIPHLKTILQTSSSVFLERDAKEGGEGTMEQVQEAAIKLFRSVFYGNGSPQDLELLSQKVEYLCESIALGKKTKKELIVWHRDELEAAKQVLNKIREQVNGDEWDTAEKDVEQFMKELTVEHVDLHVENIQLEKQLENKTKQKLEEQVRELQKLDEGVAASLVLKLIHEQQLEAKRAKLSEFEANYKDISANNASFLSSAGRDPESPVSPQNDAQHHNLEDRLCGMIKTYSQTKSKLNSAAKNYHSQKGQFIKSLVKFPEKDAEAVKKVKEEINEDLEILLLQALNPNNERVTTEFSRLYNNSSLSTMVAQQGNHQGDTLSDPSARATLIAMDQQIEQSVYINNNSIYE